MTARGRQTVVEGPDKGLYRDIIENCADAIVVFNEDQTIRFVNRAAEAMFGWPGEASIGMPLGALIPERFRETHMALANGFAASGDHARFMLDRNATIFGLRSDGTEFPVSVSILKSRDDAGLALVAIVRDITAQKSLEQELEKLAGTDPLTGINNRRSFIARAEEECARAVRYGNSMALAMIDIDRFKDVNDKYGHAMGDQVLCEVVRIFREGIRKPDIFGRWGGEEFALLLPETNEQSALVLLQRLRYDVADNRFNPQDSLTVPLHFTVSIGVAGFRPREETLEELINRADQGLYSAKQSGRNKVCGIQAVSPSGAEGRVA